MLQENIKQKFLEIYPTKIVQNEHGCYEWVGVISKEFLHCIICLNNKTYSVKQLVYTISSGNYLKNNKFIKSVCGNKICVKYEHLASYDDVEKMKPYYWNLFKEKININENQCWIWMAGHSSDGYGKFSLKDHTGIHTLRAHVYSWKYHYGELPEFTTNHSTLRTCVLHKCDVKLCVNPEHLFVGSSEMNMQDMVKKNRSSHSEMNIKSKLTEEQVLAIRNESKDGNLYLKDVALKYNISYSNLYDIIYGKYWTRTGGPIKGKDYF